MGFHSTSDAAGRTLFLALLLSSAGCVAQPVPPLRDGDVVFQTSRSSQSVAIQRATGSPYSHMGVVFTRGGRAYVFEAVATVRFTPFERWAGRGSGGHVVVKRLKGASTVLTPEAVARLRATARGFEGRRYDPAFEWSDDRIYCSELVYKLYDRALGIHLGKLQRLGELHLEDPVVQAKLQERYRGRVPLDETVISPASIFGDPALETAWRR